MLRIWTTHRAVSSEVKDFAHINSGSGKLIPGSLDIGNYQKRSLRRPGRSCRQVRAELDRARRAMRRKLDYARRRYVLPPSELPVKLRCSIHIRNRNNDDL